MTKSDDAKIDDTKIDDATKLTLRPQALFRFQKYGFFRETNMLLHPLAPLVMLLAQALTWVYFHRRIKAKILKRALLTFFLLINALALFSFHVLYYSPNPPPNNGFLWDCLCRPVFTYEAVVLFWLPLSAGLRLSRRLLNRLSAAKGRTIVLRLTKKEPGFFDLPLFVLLALLLAAGFGYSRQLAPPEITERTIRIPGLAPSLQGFKIALLSDLHYGHGYNLRDLTAAMALTSARQPDLVVLAGDLCDRLAAFGLDYRLPLSNLNQTTYGVYGVLGNHDLRVDSPPELTENLRAAGLKMLVDERVNLPEVPLTLIGFNDRGDDKTRRRDFRLDFSALSGPAAPQGNLVVVVNHRPEGVLDAANRGTRLFLAGHLHGGQFQFPFFEQANFASWILGYEYTSGLYQIGDMTLFVTRGLADGLHFRLFAWPEIAILTLTG